MTKRISARALGAAALLAAAAAGSALTLPAPAAAQGRVLGGFNPASTSDARVQGAAAFLAGEVGGELASVDSAQAQSTASTNYRLEITLADSARWSGQVTASRDGGYTMMGQASQLQPPPGEGEETDTGTNDGSDTSGSETPDDDEDAPDLRSHR
jgi:hypothetical protein